MSARLHVAWYEALDTHGATVRGEVAAATVEEARRLLLDRGLLPIHVRRASWSHGHARSLRSAELALGLRLLADLLAAGLPVERALASFEELAPPGWRAAVTSMRRSVREGQSLAGALAHAPLRIPPLVIGMAQAGEAGDGIAGAMRRAAEHTESIAATRAALRSALAYPSLVALAGAGSLGVLLGVVIPRFAVILADLGQDLPASTRHVLQVSAFARASLGPLIVVGTIVAWGLVHWTRTPHGRQAWHRLLWRVPVLGSLRRSASTGHIAASLGALLDSGVPVAAGLRIAARSAGDAEAERRLDGAITRIAAGAALSAALADTGAVTAMTARLVRAGEATGRLPALLDHSARLERDRVGRTVTTAVRALEPALIIAFAGLVGIVAIALLQAVYAVRPA